MPDINLIFELHKRLALNKQTLDIVWNHCQIVSSIADQLIANLKSKGIGVDEDLSLVGALIHDIGVYSCFDKDNQLMRPYIEHGVLGEAVLLKENFPSEVARFASHHTGVGISKEDIAREHLPLPVEDFLPDSLEEELVCFADKFHSKDSGFNTYEKIVQDLRQFGDDKVLRLDELKEKFGLPELSAFKK